MPVTHAICDPCAGTRTVGHMDDIIICIGCRNRTTVEEIEDGCHSHLDEMEVKSLLDRSVNADD
jgi:hypothetical protein